MPGEDAAYSPGEMGQPDLYPKTEEEHAALLRWALGAFQAAESARKTWEPKWDKYYRMYRSFVQKKKTDWQSKFYVPYVFSTVETIAPRLLLQLPRFVATPVGPEDVEPAKLLETALNYSVAESGLRSMLTDAEKSALIYGTGILKTFYRQDVKTAFKPVETQLPVFEEQQQPVIDPGNGMTLLDPDGNPVTEAVQVPTGEVQTITEMQPFEFVSYEGPAAVAVDIQNFWPAPEATDIRSARYVIHRTYKEMSEFLKLVEQGVYHLPPEIGPQEIADVQDEPLARRLASIDLGPGSNSDTTRHPLELLEFHTNDNRIITIANRKAIVRHSLSPFWHGEKPFVRVLDYPVPGEFWGIGEVETIEGLQDIQNALINQRVDHGRFVLNPVFAVDVGGIEDPRDLQIRPGRAIRMRGGQPVREVFDKVDLGVVPVSAFTEAEMLERLIERVTGVTAAQTGVETPSMNDTATGVSILQEAGNAKFAMKAVQLEIALRELSKHWGSLLQQFTDEPRLMRWLGPGGQYLFGVLTPEGVQGALDFDIEVSSTTQTETTRRQQDMELLKIAGAVWPNAVPKLFQDILEDYGKKDLVAYIWGPQVGLMPGLTPAGVPAGAGMPGIQGPGMMQGGMMQPGMMQGGMMQGPPGAQPMQPETEQPQ